MSRRRLPVPTRNRPVEDLIRRWQLDGDRAARDRVVEELLPLVRWLARCYDSSNEPLEDLVQVAVVGLLGAIDRFEPDRGAPFRVFAIPTIRGELKRHFRETGWTVHVARASQELALRVERGSRELEARLGKAPTEAALSRHLGLPVDQVAAGLRVQAARTYRCCSLDVPVAKALVPLGETIAVSEDGFGCVEARLSLRSVVARLPYLERQVVFMCLQNEMRQTEIAHRLGCSQMQVSRLLTRGLARAHGLLDLQGP